MSGLLKFFGTTILLLSLNSCGYHWTDQLYQSARNKQRLKRFDHNICLDAEHYSSFQRQLISTLKNQHLLAKPDKTNCYQLFIKQESTSIPNINSDSSQSQRFTINFSTRLALYKPNKKLLFTQNIRLTKSISVNPGELISGNNRLHNVKEQLYQEAASSFLYHLSSTEANNDVNPKHTKKP